MRWLMIACLLFSLSATAQEEPAKIDLEKARELTEVKTERDAYIKSLTTVVSAYVKVLNTQEEIVTKAGNLEALEAIKAERNKINVVEPGSSDAKWEKNKNLATAQKAFNDGLSKAKKDYLSKLEAVQKKLVQDKKIEEAKLVKGLVDDMRLEEVKKIILGKWKQIWVDEIGKQNYTIWSLTEEGVVKAWSTKAGDLNDFSGSWKLKDSKVTINTNSRGDITLLFLDNKLVEERDRKMVLVRMKE